VGSPPPGAQGWQPSNAKSCECRLEMEAMNDTISNARASCPADDANAWTGTQTVTSTVVSQYGQF